MCALMVEMSLICLKYGSYSPIKKCFYIHLNGYSRGCDIICSLSL